LKEEEKQNKKGCVKTDGAHVGCFSFLFLGGGGVGGGGDCAAAPAGLDGGNERPATAARGSLCKQLIVAGEQLRKRTSVITAGHEKMDKRFREKGGGGEEEVEEE